MIGNDGIFSVKNSITSESDDIVPSVVMKINFMLSVPKRFPQSSCIISSEFKSLAAELNLNYLDLLLHVGEDFELVFTINKKNLHNLNFKYLVIGEVTDSKKVEIMLSDSTVRQISSRGYDHYVS